jgi:hypothetical protein
MYGKFALYNTHLLIVPKSEVDFVLQEWYHIVIEVRKFLKIKVQI